ncbi:MAG: sugar ABC transporter permease [Actinobacteria bacterium]|uniref:multiple monosaccharide ABC transporter permease n=1 Tax=Propionicimonas sp. T2.31MG-18 TaxID=3157620 RepID=UPI0035E7EA26|nr:sugar ABC transporter permease [Actinomycetota bacterium]MCA0306452.1 sugar ABC transporter permease [Actinomycetota bacterium]MCA0434922.1 sugar ABC transporter permease [Actinomycetota bacterium]
MEALKKLFGGSLRQFGMLFVLVALAIFFHLMTGGLVITPTNLMNLINGNSYVLVLAIGMVMVIVIGHIDLAVGSVAAFVGIVVAIAMRDWGIPWWAGVLLGLAIGALCGAWQGFWVAYMGIPGFIVTLAGYMFFRGANQFIGKSLTVPVPKDFQYLGAGYLPEWGPNTGMNNSTLLLGLITIAVLVWMQLRNRRALIKVNAEVPPFWVTIVRIALLAVVVGWLTWMFGSGRPGTSFPVPGLILAALVILYTFVTQRTVTGRHIYAVGGNRLAAELSGVNTRRTYFLVMLNMSVLAAFAGIMFVGRSTASGPFDGVGWELDAIAAVFIGGAAVSGGVGTVIGSIIGGLVMAVLNNGLQLMSAGSDVTQMIKGLVLLAAVALDVWQKRQGKASITGMFARNKEAATTTPAEAGLLEEQAGANPTEMR